nr:uncharacterized protein CTRU02_10742 [Colletotrichum truncatum]KAF6786618.1 hypothetical protein CTRU02_10742 [Colletotrichum truncatum]
MRKQIFILAFLGDVAFGAGGAAPRLNAAETVHCVTYVSTYLVPVSYGTTGPGQGSSIFTSASVRPSGAVSSGAGGPSIPTGPGISASGGTPPSSILSGATSSGNTLVGGTTSPSVVASNPTPSPSAIVGQAVIFLIAPAPGTSKRHIKKRAVGGFVDIGITANAQTCDLAAVFTLSFGQLYAGNVPIYYLAGESFKPFRPSTSVPSGAITTTFAAVDGVLQFTNPALPNGRSGLCQDSVTGQVYITFTSSPPGCAPVVLITYGVPKRKNRVGWSQQHFTRTAFTQSEHRDKQAVYQPCFSFTNSTTGRTTTTIVAISPEPTSLTVPDLSTTASTPAGASESSPPPSTTPLNPSASASTVESSTDTSSSSSTTSTVPQVTGACSGQTDPFSASNGDQFNPRCGRTYVGPVYLSESTLQTYVACAEACSQDGRCTSFHYTLENTCSLFTGIPQDSGEASIDSGLRAPAAGGCQQLTDPFRTSNARQFSKKCQSQYAGRQELAQSTPGSYGACAEECSQNGQCTVFFYGDDGVCITWAGDASLTGGQGDSGLLVPPAGSCLAQTDPFGTSNGRQVNRHCGRTFIGTTFISSSDQASYAACAEQCSANPSCTTFFYTIYRECAIYSGVGGFNGNSSPDVDSGVMVPVPGSCLAQTDPFNTLNGIPFNRHCGLEYTSSTSLSSNVQGSYIACAEQCSLNPLCTTFSFTVAGTCATYGGFGEYAGYAGPDVDSGVVIPPAGSCQSLSSPFSTMNERQFTRACGYEYIGQFLISQSNLGTYQACAEQCSADISCTVFVMRQGNLCSWFGGDPRATGVEDYYINSGIDFDVPLTRTCREQTDPFYLQSGRFFNQLCGSRYTGSTELSNTPQANYLDCAQQCTSDPSCTTFHLTGQRRCFTFSGANAQVGGADPTVNSGIAAPPPANSCQGSSDPFVAPNGRRFNTHCGLRYAGTEQLGGVVEHPNFAACAEDCSKRPTCTIFKYSPNKICILYNGYAQGGGPSTTDDSGIAVPGADSCQGSPAPFVTTNGRQFTKDCGRAYSGSNLISQTRQETYAACAEKCAGEFECVGFTLYTFQCLTFIGPFQPTSQTANFVNSGVLIEPTVSCATSPNPLTTVNGKQYETRCGERWEGSSQIQQRTLGSNSFLKCAELCSQQPQCTLFSYYSDRFCELWEGATTTTGQNAGFNAGFLLQP